MADAATHSNDERARVLREIRELTVRILAPEHRSVDVETARAWDREREETIDRYFDTLPKVTFARCPHCDAPAASLMDLDGLDGLWWRTNSPRVAGYFACEHFLTLLGALNYRGHLPREAFPDPRVVILSGPEVPFVVPRLLGFEGAACVLSSLAVSGGRYRAYLSSYFAEPPVPAERGHQPWLRKWLWAADASGRKRWSVAADEFDYDIASWIGQEPSPVRWTVPDQPGGPLYRGLENCPYTGIQGRRFPLEVSEGAVAEWTSQPGESSRADGGDA